MKLFYKIINHGNNNLRIFALFKNDNETVGCHSQLQRGAFP